MHIIIIKYVFNLNKKSLMLNQNEKYIKPIIVGDSITVKYINESPFQKRIKIFK